MTNETQSTIRPDVDFTSRKHREEIEAKARAEHAAHIASLPDPEIAAQRELAQRRNEAHREAYLEALNDKVNECAQATRDRQADLNAASIDPNAGLDQIFTAWQELRKASANEAKIRHEVGSYSGSVSVLIDRMESVHFGDIVEVALTGRTQNHVKDTWDKVAKKASDAGNKAVDSITE